MRNMKDSGIKWIGEIPDSWYLSQTRRLFRYEKTIVGDKVDNYERLALTLNGVVKRSKDDSEGLQPEKFEGYQILRENELVFKMIDLENVNTSRVGLSPFTGLVSPAYIILKNDNKDNRYAYYWFMSMYYNEVFNHLGGDGVRSALNAKDMLSLPIPNISISEQKAISDYLDSKCALIDTIIFKQKNIIENLKKYRMSVITETVTKGLNPNVKYKNINIKYIGQIPSSWNICRLFFLTYKIGDGLHGSPEFDDNGDCYFINGNNLGKDTIEIKLDTKKTSNIEYEKYKLNLDEDTLLISLNGTIGNLSRYKGEKIVLGKSAGYIKLNTSLVAIDYLKYYLQSLSTKTMFEISLSGTTIGNLSLETLRNLPVCIMSLEEQNQIASYLNLKCLSIDKSIELRQQEIEKLSLYKKSLIYEVVTGKKEV